MLLVVVGLAIGLSLGLVGGGGAVIAVPALVYAFGVDVHDATTASLAMVALAAMSATAGHARARRVCWRLAGVVALSSMPAALVGGAIHSALDGDTLLLLFAPVLLACGWAMWKRASVPAVGGCDRCPPGRPLVVVAAGTTVGLMSGLFGVGGGFLVVPVLVIGLRCPISSAVGTSIVVIAFVASVGFLSHLTRGGVPDPWLTTRLAVACVGGAAVAGCLAPRVPQPALARGFSLLAAGVAAWLIASVLLLGGPSAPGRP